jgi:23S rRNA pseudouridine1911/1915/1917 synthase
MDPQVVEFIVEPNYAGWTLAAYVSEKLKRPLAPDKLDRMLRGRTLVHSEPVLLPETRVWPGLRFGLRKRSPGDDGQVPKPLAVVFQDEALLIVEKPAGLALHPTARFHVSTLTHALETHHRNSAGLKPDPAHRLDRETSGLVACGREPRWTRRLKAAFAARQVAKAYLALVEGAPASDAFEIDLPLAVGTERIQVKVRVDPAGAQSLTACTVVRRLRDATGAPLTLLRCVPRTGRQHQIRAHLLAKGLPLVGDKLYGPDENIFLRLAESGGRPAPQGEFDELITAGERARLRLGRQALHASELTVPHPETSGLLRFDSPLPADIQALIDTLVSA